MKNKLKITLFAAVFLSGTVSAQVAIGKAAISTLPSPPAAPNTTNPSVSLEFGDYVTGQGKGIIVPWVTGAANVAGAVGGTIIFDTADKLMKYRKADGTWFNLSKNETTTIGSTQNVNTTGAVNTSLQDTNNGVAIVENTNAKTSIGTPTATSGILVLEDTNKAMILPKVASPHLNVINPAPGMMVYDTTAKQLAVFNGTVWNFWKP